MHPAYTNKSPQAVFITAMDQMTARDVKRVTAVTKRWHFTSRLYTYTFKWVHVIPIVLHVCELTLKPETTVQDCILTIRLYF